MRTMIGVFAILIVAGCGQKTNGGVGITLRGALVASNGSLSSALTVSNRSVVPVLDPPAPGMPLAGYQLYCMTFTSPPVAASDTASADGSVSLTLDTSNVRLGCFILDAQGNGVASLLFITGSNWGQTITLTSDANLGNVPVDLNDGVAQATVPGGGALADSTGLACPLGTWQAADGGSGCTGSMTITYWIAQTTDGQYLLSFTAGPELLADNVTCGQYSISNIPATYSDGALHFSLFRDQCGGLGGADGTFTPDANCTNVTIAMAWHNCGYCGENGECKDCGTTECTEPFSGSGTRQ